jgi:SAM-dependent methyltransferase
VKKGETQKLSSKWLVTEDYQSSSTSLMLKDYLKVVSLVRNGFSANIIDLGCGYGGIALLTADYLKASVIGVEVDETRIKFARNRGLRVMNYDFNHSTLPLPDASFDLVLCNGVLCHLPSYDNVIVESRRLLKRNGYLLCTLPNMANFIQRFTLLLGYQPSDVLISDRVRTGTIFMSGGKSYGHVHGATAKAIKELLEYYKFADVRIFKGNPTLIGPYANWNWLFQLIGKLFPLTLSRRLIVMARKA